MSPATLLFWVVVMVIVASAALVVLSRNILHAAFSLCLCFTGVAGIYLFLHADFVAAVQLIVYVGGILVLVLFAVMFSTHTQEGSVEPHRGRLALGAGLLVGALAFASVVLLVKNLRGPINANDTVAMARAEERNLARLEKPPDGEEPGSDEEIAASKARLEELRIQSEYRRTVGVDPDNPIAERRVGLGHLFMGRYILPFEVASVLILAALVGAVVIVRKETRA